MSTNRSRRIDRDAAEQLLGGAVGGPSAGQDASLTGPDGPGQVARVLAAAAAPATSAELAGEEAALAAFREASLTPEPVVTPVRRRSMATAALARAFSTKAAAAVLGATALCGVAVAAGTGNLPALGGGPTEPEHAVAASGSPTESTHGTTGKSGTASPSGSARPSAGAQADPPRGLAPSASATPGASSPGTRGAHPSPPAALVPLCQSFTDRTNKGERPGQLTADPLFGPLVAAAGGAEEVPDFCSVAPGHSTGDHPSTPAQPSPSGHKGNSNGNANGNTNDEDNNGGNGAKPGKGGVTVPTPPTLPTPPDARPSRTGPSEDEQSARR
ncbi:hypothetical protein ACIRVF_14985 [Kitasatospora sp. NPDC101157]|uniref:hypothetical protein n=1 Tax=Kitasatospora sp. NPDC101157 TaxID=3364098 RepID=UPI0037FE024F